MNLQRSLQTGSFRKILQLVAEHNEVVKGRLCHGPQNAMYISPCLQ